MTVLTFGLSGLIYLLPDTLTLIMTVQGTEWQPSWFRSSDGILYLPSVVVQAALLALHSSNHSQFPC